MNELKPIEPVIIPTSGTATQLYVQANSFSAAATTCALYYYLADEFGVMLIQGNLQMTEEQFTTWGADNNVLFDIVATEKVLTIIIQ
jgi:hypothetical protein